MVSWFEQTPWNQRYRGAFWARLPPFPEAKKALPVTAVVALILLAGAGAAIGLILQDSIGGDATIGVSQALYINPAYFDSQDISPARQNSLVTVADDGQAFGVNLEVYGGDLYTLRLPISNRGRQDLVAELSLPWANSIPGYPITVDVNGLYWFIDANNNSLWDSGEAMVLSNDGILDSGDQVVRMGYAPFGNGTAGLYYLDANHDGNFTTGEAVVNQNGGNYSNLLEPGDVVVTSGLADMLKFTAVAVGPGKWRFLVPAAADPIEYQIVLAFADATPTGFYELPAEIYPVKMSQGLKQLVKVPSGHNYDIDPSGPVDIRYIGHDRAGDNNLVLRTAGTDLRLDLGDMARGQTLTYTAALGIANEGGGPVEVTGIQVTGSGAQYMRLWLHNDANRLAQAEAPGEATLIWNGSQGQQTFAWELAGGNGDVDDMWGANTPIYPPAGVRALTTPWQTDNAADSDHVWVQVEVSIPNVAQVGLYTGTVKFTIED